MIAAMRDRAVQLWRWLSVWWLPLDEAAFADQSAWTVAGARSADPVRPQALAAGPLRWSRRAIGVSMTRSATFGEGRRVFVLVLPRLLSRRSRWVVR